MTSPKAESTKPNSKGEHISLSQGPYVVGWGIAGCLFAILPATLLLPQMPKLESPWTIIIPIGWACVLGALFTGFWSNALHDRMAKLRELLKDELTDDEKKQYPGRVPWLALWVGLFERAFYAILIGLDVSGGVTFIGIWIGAKLAGGWQVWSKGTTYGRAVFFSGLLGNAMSAAFGIIAGLVIRAYLAVP